MTPVTRTPSLSVPSDTISPHRTLLFFTQVHSSQRLQLFLKDSFVRLSSRRYLSSTPLANFKYTLSPTFRSTLTKLSFKKMGPYTITECVNRLSFRLELPKWLKIHPVVSIDHLEPAPHDTESEEDRGGNQGGNEFCLRRGGLRILFRLGFSVDVEELNA